LKNTSETLQKISECTRSLYKGWTSHESKSFRMF
jgi:hypothetical protein